MLVLQKWMNKEAKQHCHKVAPLTRENSLQKSYSSHVESSFWLLHLMLVETEGSRLNSTKKKRFGDNCRDASDLKARYKGLDNFFLQAIPWKKLKIKQKQRGRAHLVIISSHFLMLGGSVFLHQFFPDVNFLCAGKQCTISVHQFRSYIIKSRWRAACWGW